MDRCEHGYTRAQSCRVCHVVEDWREHYASVVYDRFLRAWATPPSLTLPRTPMDGRLDPNPNE
jgi:hypothetical protein